MAWDAEVAEKVILSVFAGLTGIAGLFLGNKRLRARNRILKERAQARDRKYEEALAAQGARHEADILKIRMEYGNAITAGQLQIDMSKDEITALALHAAEQGLQLAETALKMEHYAAEFERATGRPPPAPPDIGGKEGLKILARSGIFRFTPDPDDEVTGGVIFLVEDYPDLRIQITQYLKKKGYQVITAATVAEARERIDDHWRLFNLVLLDLMLPDSNGEVGGDAVADHLKAKGCRAPIIIFSALDHSQAVAHMKRTGAVGLISKPYEFPQLLLSIREHIRLS